MLPKSATLNERVKRVGSSMCLSLETAFRTPLVFEALGHVPSVMMPSRLARRYSVARPIPNARAAAEALPPCRSRARLMAACSPRSNPRRSGVSCKRSVAGQASSGPVVGKSKSFRAARFAPTTTSSLSTAKRALPSAVATTSLHHSNALRKRSASIWRAVCVTASNIKRFRGAD